MVSEASHFFANLQYGVNTKHGMDMIFHRINLNRELHPTNDIAFLDLTNAFNNASRPEIVKALKLNFPSLVPLFDVAYGGSNTLWYNAFPNGLYRILSDNGVMQGCASGSFFLLCWCPHSIS